MGPDGKDRRRRGVSAKMRRKVQGHRARKGFDGMSAIRKIELDSDIAITALAVMLLLFGALLGFTLWQQSEISDQQTDINTSQRELRTQQGALRRQQRDLAQLEKRDRLNSYRTAYRFCSRLNVGRAALHWVTINQLPKLSSSSANRARLRQFTRRYQRKLESKGGLPILDCEPNTMGESARYMAPKKQRVYVMRWDRFKLSTVEIGICDIAIGTLTSTRDC
jgi:hypothetical protein